MFIYSAQISFKRYVAFDRTSGSPILIKKDKNNNLHGTQLSYEQYYTLLNKLNDLHKSPTAKYVVDINTYHCYSIEDLLRFTNDKWHNYILPTKEHYDNHTINRNNESYDTTIADLFSSHNLKAIYQNKSYTVASKIYDYVVNLSNENDETFLVDIRDLNDIYEKIFYIDVNKNKFKVIMALEDSVVIECKNRIDYRDLGFKYMHPKNFMQGWDVSVDLIEAVKYKLDSIYQETRDQLNKQYF